MKKAKHKDKNKFKICVLLTLGSILLSACAIGARATGGQGTDQSALTASETAERAMESLRDLDLEQFNACTDNYVATHYNWIGIPVGREYRVFNELQQPGLKRGRHYEFNCRLSAMMMQKLAWDIKAVQEEDGQAKLTMEITNVDMENVMDEYILYLLENMIESDGIGLGQLIKDLADITDRDSVLISIMEDAIAQDVMCTTEVTVTAYREQGAWRIHLDEEFINALMGNTDAGQYSEEMEQRMAELENLQEDKLAEWEEEFTNKVERWADGLFR